MNIVVLKGNLTRDPDLRDVSLSGGKDTKVANFTVAVSRSYKKQNGDWEQATEYLDCEAWDTGAISVGKVLKKGDPVLVNGSLKQDTWEDKETGQKRSRIKVRVANFDKLARFQKSDGNTESSETAEPVAATTAPGEDIPF